MKDRDFSVSIAVSEHDRRVALDIGLDGMHDDEALSELQFLVGTFVRAGEEGAFCGDCFEPARSRMAFAADLVSTQTEIQWALQTEGVVPSTYGVLLRILEHYHCYVAPLRHVIVQGGYSKQSPPATLHAPVGRSRAVGVELPEAPGNKERRVQIEFHDPIDETVKARLFDAYAAWLRLCFGGFPREKTTSCETGISASDPYLVDAYTLEGMIYVFDSDESAFDLIVNIAANLHRTGAPVASVRIDG